MLYIEVVLLNMKHLSGLLLFGVVLGLLFQIKADIIHKCIHHELNKPVVTLNVPPPNPFNSAQRRFEASTKLSPYIIGGNELLNDAFMDLGEHLYLTQSNEHIGITTVDGCGDAYDGQQFEIPSDANLVVFAGQEGNQLCTEETAAYAYVCARLPSGRPFIGYIHVCDLEVASLTVLVHEAYHVLGFSEESFQRYDPNDRFLSVFYPRTPQNGLVKYTRTDGDLLAGQRTFTVDVQLLISTAPTRYARGFFDCDVLPGVEIVDSHFSKRLYHDDVMTAVLTPNMRPQSNLALWTMAASGWYTAVPYNDSVVPWERAKGKGCDFAFMNCLYYAKHHAEENDVFCFSNNDDFDYCQIFEHEHPIPTNMQYFREIDVGGYPYMEYCPLLTGDFELHRLTSGGSTVKSWLGQVIDELRDIIKWR